MTYCPAGAASKAKRPEALALILENASVRHPRPVRLQAIRLLGENYRQNRPITGTLTMLLKDEDPQVRQGVLQALLTRKDRSAVPALRALANAAQDADERAAAGDTAGKLEEAL